MVFENTDYRRARLGMRHYWECLVVATTPFSIQIAAYTTERVKKYSPSCVFLFAMALVVAHGFLTSGIALEAVEAFLAGVYYNNVKIDL